MLAGGGVDVSRPRYENSGVSVQEKFNSFEWYGVQTLEAAFGSHDDDEMEMDIRVARHDQLDSGTGTVAHVFLDQA